MEYVDILESWAQRAAEALQEFCDEAQVASGNPDGECQLLDIRQLLDEHSRIMAGIPTWQSQINTDGAANKIDFGDHENGVS